MHTPITTPDQTQGEDSRRHLEFLAVLNGIDEPVYVSDPRTYELIYANRVLVDHFGPPNGRTCYDYLQNNDRPCSFCTNIIIFGDQQEGSHIWEFRNKVTGRYYRCIDRAIHWPDGRRVRLEIAVDVTDRKQAELALEAEKEHLSVTLRSIGDGVITTDVNGTVVLMNRVAERLTGWRQEEAQGKSLDTVFTIINELTREPHANPVQKVLATGAIVELANHTVLVSRDGTERAIADSAAPIADRDNTITGVVLVFRDMTEKQKYIELTQNAQKLESLGLLAGGIAHDFNNLLGGIFGYIDLASSLSREGEVTRYLSEAMNTIDRARALTRQLLTFAKGGAPVKERAALFPFVQETAQFALSGAPVSCRCTVPGDLWTCNYDKNQIAQVIDNLIINAQQAMPVGGTIDIVAENITLEKKQHPLLTQGPYVKLTINDRGIGIPRELLGRIFDPFYTTKDKGHGLGLPTCYSIINRHGGHIDVESEPGNGSSFMVYLPATPQSPPSADSNEGAKHKGGGTVMGGGTVIVMDDEAVMRDTMCAMLKTLGYSVLPAKNGKEAIGCFETETREGRAIAALIFDLTVPGAMGGVEAVEHLRRQTCTVPVFVASGYAQDPVMKDPVAYGFTASICKPFRKEELAALLEKHGRKGV